MAGDVGSLVPDRADWPEGRVALITKGELAGMYALVFPETAGRWIVYVAEEQEGPLARSTPHVEEWGLEDDQALVKALGDLGLVWVAPAEEEARIERHLFGLRAERRSKADRWRARFNVLECARAEVFLRWR